MLGLRNAGAASHEGRRRGGVWKSWVGVEARRAQFGKTRMRAMKCRQNGRLSNGLSRPRPRFRDYVIDPALENIF
jgi:hypothetical protein